MSQELFFTSAPRGLNPGTTGLCTVAVTHGLPPTVQQWLEGLSGYRPVFEPHDARAAENPVAQTHHRLTVGGQSFHVLSRVCAAGLDYSQRENKFAHHVVLAEGELPRAGPAWLLQQPGFMETAWDGEVKVLPAGRPPPRGDRAPGVCREWQRATGDAGWAGVPGEAFLADPTRLVYLLFDLGVDPLPLLAESVALLPAERRWEVTFSTYFTGQGAGSSCAWRCILRGSPEAQKAARMPGVLLLDLGADLGRPEGGALVEQARTGRPGMVRTAAGSRRQVAPRRPTPAETASGNAHPSRSLPANRVEEGLLVSVSGIPAGDVPPPPRPPRRQPKPGVAGHWHLLVGLAVGIVLGVLLIGLPLLVVWTVGGGSERAKDHPNLQADKTTSDKLFDGLVLLERDRSGEKRDVGRRKHLTELAELLEQFRLKELGNRLRKAEETKKKAEEELAAVKQELNRLKPVNPASGHAIRIALGIGGLALEQPPAPRPVTGQGDAPRRFWWSWWPWNRQIALPRTNGKPAIPAPGIVPGPKGRVN